MQGIVSEKNCLIGKRLRPSRIVGFLDIFFFIRKKKTSFRPD